MKCEISGSFRGMLQSRSLGGDSDIESKIFVASLVVGGAVAMVFWARRRFLRARTAPGDGSSSPTPATLDFEQ